MGGCEGSQPVMARNLHQKPLGLNPPCPIPTGGAPVVLWTYIFLCPGRGSSKGFGGSGTFHLRSAVSFGQCWLPAPAVAVRCGSQQVCFPTTAPRPHSSLSFLSFCSLKDLLPAPTSWRPLSWISKRQESQNQIQMLKRTNRVRKAAEGCPSMPKAVGLHGTVAAVTQHGAGSQVKGKGLSQDLTAGWWESAVAT